MANLLEATTHYCKNGHDVRDKEATVAIRNNGTTVCKACRTDTARKSHVRRQRAIAKAQNKSAKPTKVVSPNHPVHAPVQPKLSDVVVEIVNILRDNPDLEVTTLVTLSKAVRNKK